MNIQEGNGSNLCCHEDKCIHVIVLAIQICSKNKNRSNSVFKKVTGKQRYPLTIKCDWNQNKCNFPGCRARVTSVIKRVLKGLIFLNLFALKLLKL